MIGIFSECYLLSNPESFYDAVEIAQRLLCFALITSVDLLDNAVLALYGVDNLKVKLNDDPRERRTIRSGVAHGLADVIARSPQ